MDKEEKKKSLHGRERGKKINKVAPNITVCKKYLVLVTLFFFFLRI
jgi:hypothetical protein